MRSTRTVLLAVTLLGAAALAEESAQEISRKSRERGALNLVGLTAELKLVSVSGDKTKEQVLTTTSKTIGGKNHALARFTAPAGVSGVAVLTIEGKAGEGDEVSVYLPKLKRVRKVAKSDRGKSFMDTDFAYADIASNGASDENLKKLPDGEVAGRPCFVLEGKGDEASPYGAVKMWVDKETYVPMQVEYADKEGKPFKKYKTLKLKSFQDRVIAAESVMENLKTKSSTQMTVLKLEEKTPDDAAFSERGLERG